MPEVNNFDVLKQMCIQNLDIRLGVDVLSLKRVKAGTQVLMGVGGDVVGPMFVGELTACLIIYNKKQFDETKASLAAAEEAIREGKNG
jgi:hypothetical protein